MRGLHLKQVGGIWHYQRRRPIEFNDVEPRALIRFSLRTRDPSTARLKSAQISFELEREWETARIRGVVLSGQNLAKRYQAAAEVHASCGFSPKTAFIISDQELLERLRLLLQQDKSVSEKKAVLGLIEQTSLSMADAFDRFWEHIQDEWMRLSHDQRRVKRNIYLGEFRSEVQHRGQIWYLSDAQRETVSPCRTIRISRPAREIRSPL